MDCNGSESTGILIFVRIYYVYCICVSKNCSCLNKTFTSPDITYSIYFSLFAKKKKKKEEAFYELVYCNTKLYIIYKLR